MVANLDLVEHMVLVRFGGLCDSVESFMCPQNRPFPSCHDVMVATFRYHKVWQLAKYKAHTQLTTVYLIHFHHRNHDPLLGYFASKYSVK